MMHHLHGILGEIFKEGLICPIAMAYITLKVYVQKVGALCLCVCVCVHSVFIFNKWSYGLKIHIIQNLKHDGRTCVA